MSRIQRILAWGLFTLVLLVLSGWLLADHLTPRAFGVPSHALPLQAAQSELDREIVPLVARHDGQTGIILVPDGLDAFAARALSARKAGRSQTGRAHVCTPVTNAHIVCGLLLEQKNNKPLEC